MFEECWMECPLRSSISVLWQRGRSLSTCQDDNLDDEGSQEPAPLPGRPVRRRVRDVRPSSWSPVTSAPGPDHASPVTNIRAAMTNWLWSTSGETLQHWRWNLIIEEQDCVRRCFLIISVTIMNCFNVVNVVLVSWDQLPGPGELRSTLETNQWSSGAWSGWRHPSSAKHTAQTTGHGEHLEKTC